MSRRYFWGGLVIFIGLILFLETAGIISGNFWKYFWSVVLIVIGISILFPDRKY